MLSAPVIVLVCWVFVCRKYGKFLFEGLAIRRIPWKTLLVSVAIGVVGAVAAMLLMSKFSTGKSSMSKLVSTPLGFTVVVFLCLTLPFIEEIYYRGFIYPVLRKKVGVVGGIILMTVWFGGAHAAQLWQDPAALIFVAAMGLVWTLQRELSKSVVAGMVTHWIYNATLFAPDLIGWLG